MKLRKSIAVLFLGLCILGSIFAQGQKDSSDKAITLSFLTHRTDIADSTIQDLANQYMAENPNIKIEIEAVDSSELSLVLSTKMAAKELPDIAVVLRDIPVTDLPQYFIPLDDIGYTKDTLYFYNNLVAADGHCYGFNVAVNPIGIIYNKNAFAKAGIKTIPKTLDEFYAVCDKLVAAGIIPFGSGYKDRWPIQIFAEEMLWSFEQMGDVTYKANLQYTDKLFDPSVKGGIYDSFSFLRGMYQKGYLEPDITSSNFNTMTQRNARGEIAMWYGGTWYPPSLVAQGCPADQVGMFKFPGAKGVLLADDKVLGVAKNSKHPEEAKAFLAWLFEDQRLANASDSVSPVKSAPITNQWVSELLAGNTTLEMGGYDPGFLKIYNSGEFDLTGSLQEYVLTNDPASITDRLNEKWAKTRAQIAK